MSHFRPVDRETAYHPQMLAALFDLHPRFQCQRKVSRVRFLERKRT